MSTVDEISETLLKVVELKTGVFRSQLSSESRKRNLVMARCVYVNLLGLFTDLSEVEISTMISKDRTSVYHMYKLHSDLITVDKSYKKLFEECSDKYVAMVSTAKYMLVDPSTIMDRVRKAELEIMELKNILTTKLSSKLDDELVTS